MLDSRFCFAAAIRKNVVYMGFMEDLEKVLSAVGLPYPMPDRWDKPDEALIREYISKGVQVVSYPGLTVLPTICYAAAIREHASVIYRDQWDDLVAMYFAAPANRSRQELASLLAKVAGRKTEYIDKIIDVVEKDRPENMEFWIVFLINIVSQSQWNRLALLLVDDDALASVKIARETHSKRLAKRGVIIWVPGEDLKPD